jgi:HD-like signal output (HDOD) protein
MRSAEAELIGMDHCQVGLMIARKWQLSEDLTDALAGHHSTHDSEPGGVPLAHAVAMADGMAHAMGATIPGGLSLGQGERDRMTSRWPFTAEVLAQLSAAVAAEVEKAKVFLEIATRR